MATRLANSIFQGRSTDKLITEDAYSIVDNITRNAFFDSIKGVYSDLIDNLNTKAGKNAIKDLIKAATSETVDKEQLLDKALNTLGTSRYGILKNLNGSIKTKLVEAGSVLMGDSSKKVIDIVYNELKISTTTDNVNDAGDLIDLIKDISGGEELLEMIDVEAESAVVGGLLSSAISEGIPEVMDDILDLTGNSTVKVNALAYAAKDALNSGRTDTVNKIIDEIGANKIFETDNKATKTLLSSFTLEGKSVSEHTAARTDLVDTLTRLDADWDKESRNGEKVFSLSAYSNMSEDSKKLLLQEEPQRTLALAVDSYKTKSVDEVIKELYPNALLTG